MSSRMEQIIEEIEEYIDNCKYQPLSSTKIVVNKDELEELLTELKMKTPEEIKRYQKIISNKEAILADAQAKADAIIAQAQVQTSELVSEHQIMQQAYAQANEVVMIATKQAQEILDRLARVAAEEEEKKQREIDAAVRQKIEEERARLQKEEADETISDDKLSAILGEKSPERKETPQAAEVSQEVETPQVVEKQTDSGEQVSEVIEATVETEQE